MSFQDNQLAFQTNWSTPQAITVTADGNRIVDLTGAGVGNPPAMIDGFPSVNTNLGFDIGAGDGVAIPYLYVTVTTGFTSGNTLTVSLSAAPDSGTYTEGAYTQIYESAAVTASTLVAGSTLLVPVPPTLFNWPSEAKPRFYKVTYTCSGAVTGSVLAGLMLNPPSTLLLGQYSNNFVVV
jgi:hypothetical protein